MAVFAVWDPIAEVGEVAAKAFLDAWTTMLLALWEAGLFLLRLALTFMDEFLTPDLSGAGPGGTLYRTAFWMSAVLVLLIGMLQLGVAAFRREVSSLGRLLVGLAQYGLVWVGWLTYATLLLSAASGLTRAMMTSLLDVTEWSTWEPFEPLNLAGDLVERSAAGVLGLMGLLLVWGAVGHLLVMLTRAGTLIVLAATTPIAAAGLLHDGFRVWFWKAFRWFHAAALTPVLTVLVLGVGVQMATGVANGAAGSSAAAIGTVVPAVLLIVVGAFSPLVLFKLLAFTDPSTSSGAGMRAGLSAQGGVQGLLSPSGGGGTSAASAVGSSGSSAGEAAAGAATGARVGAVLGPVGAAAGAVLAVVHSAGTRGAAIGADMANMMGVGHGTYVPDFSGSRMSTPPRRDVAVPDVHGAPTDTAPGGTDAAATYGSRVAGEGASAPRRVAREGSIAQQFGLEP